jgi:hypothetical protein
MSACILLEPLPTSQYAKPTVLTVRDGQKISFLPIGQDLQ